MTMYTIEVGYEGCGERGCCLASKIFLFEAEDLEAAETRADKAAECFDGYVISVEESDEYDIKTYEVRQ